MSERDHAAVTLQRVHAMIRAQAPVRAVTPARRGVASAPGVRPLATALGGDVEADDAGAVVVRRRIEGDRRYGDRRVRDIASQTNARALALLAGQAKTESVASAEPRPGPVLYVDLETTGLSGGAGTVAFLVGIGFFDGDAFAVWQYVLPDLGIERGLLASVARHIAGASGIVTFNGKSFDLPVLETRWLMHRMSVPALAGPHLDLLHPARRLWRQSSCALTTLERHWLGVARRDDVPGWEVPGRYFAYLRGADPALLAPVLEHNWLDVCSLAALTAEACRLVDEGHSGAAHPRQCLGLGRLYERARRFEAAAACYRHVAEARGGGAWPRPTRDPTAREEARVVRVEAWYRLARWLRRERRHGEAARAWAAILQLGAGPGAWRREATEALAIHHEHRARNLTEASAYARNVVEEAPDVRRREEAKRRLSRVQRKLAAGRSGLEPAGPARPTLLPEWRPSPARRQ